MSQPSLENYPYVWHFKRYLPERFGQPCKVTARGTKKFKNIEVEFADGFKTISTRFAVRRRKEEK